MAAEVTQFAGHQDRDEPDERTALYRIYGVDDELLYVGISGDFSTRWSAHARTQPWWPDIQRQTIEWHESRPLALAAETAAIKAEKPKYNGWQSGISRPEEVEKAIGKRLRELRQNSDWSQLDMARRMADYGWPWHQQTVYKVENGARPLRPGELMDAAAVFGVSVMTLLSGEGFQDAAEARSAMERALREQIAAEILAGIQEAGTAA